MSNKNYALGAKFSIPDLRDYVATTTNESFEDEFELDMPSVKSQGRVGSCVAHAIATAAEYFNKKETGKTAKLSTGYIYGNRLMSAHKGTGMYVRDALKTMTKFGDVKHKVFPENVEIPEAIDLFDSRYEELETAGLEHKFKTYFKLNDNNAIKACLKDGNPVIMSMLWYDDIELENNILKTNLVKTSSTNGHCMVIYGWNTDGWKIQNSWGTNWGNKGRFTLPYDVPMKETWGITDEISDTSLDINKPFSSAIGQKFAKFIHKIFCWFCNLFSK